MFELYLPVVYFPSLFDIFFTFGFLSLLINSFSDVLKNHMIDERWNTFMSGVVLVLYSISGIRWLILINTIISVIFVGLWKAFSKTGDGDTSAFIWLISGFLLFSPLYLLTFFVCLFVLTLCLHLSRLFIFPKLKIDPKEPVAYYPFLLFAFVSAYKIILTVLLTS